MFVLSTNLEIITDAYRDASIVPHHAAPTAEQGASALRRMNQMLAEWEQVDIEIGYFTQVDLDDEIPVPAHAERAITKKLALSLLSAIGMDAPPGLVAEADEAYRKLQVVAMNDKLEPLDQSDSPLGEGHYGHGFDINTGGL